MNPTNDINLSQIIILAREVDLIRVYGEVYRNARLCRAKRKRPIDPDRLNAELDKRRLNEILDG